MFHSRVDWEFYTESDTACKAHNDGCYWPRGKMLGGSSSINAMFYVRGNPQDYNRWAEMGNQGWDWQNALKYFKKSEGNRNKEFVRNAEYHNDKGPIAIDSFGEMHPLSNIYIEAAKERGIKYLDDINADEILGYTNAQGFVSNGRRQSTAKSFLIPAMNRSNLHIVKNAHVQKILINENNVVTGVEFVYKGKQSTVTNVRKEVILSAGAVSSPQILMLSGIGPEEHLKKNNIIIKRDAPVGQNLLDHVFTAIFFRFKNLPPTQTSPNELFQAIFDLVMNNKGSLTNLGVSQLTAMLNSANGTGYPDVQLHFFMFPQNSWEFPNYLELTKYDKTIVSKLVAENAKAGIGIIWVTLLQPKSVGYIELKSSSSNDKPKIVPNYFSDNEDMETMLRAIKQQISFTETETYRKYDAELLELPLPNCSEYKFKTDDYLRCFIRHFSNTLYHPVGTSKMGPNSDSQSVVDARLKVRGVERLRQVDAGISEYLIYYFICCVSLRK